MIPKEADMLRLIRANTSFLLYGQKASGKTRLIHNLLEKANGRFIEINCTLTSKKQSFLWLFNVELKKYLKR
jgi:MoxR-like ATPase